MPADASPPGPTRRSLLGLPETSAIGHVSSLLLRARPERLAAVAARISRLPVAEVAMTDPSGKIVVVLETRDEHEIVAAMNAMHAIDGVVSVALVYHQTEA